MASHKFLLGLRSWRPILLRWRIVSEPLRGRRAIPQTSRPRPNRLIVRKFSIRDLLFTTHEALTPARHLHHGLHRSGWLRDRHSGTSLLRRRHEIRRDSDAGWTAFRVLLGNATRVCARAWTFV